MQNSEVTSANFNVDKSVKHSQIYIKKIYDYNNVTSTESRLHEFCQELHV
jgi:hypothetical protein